VAGGAAAAGLVLPARVVAGLRRSVLLSRFVLDNGTKPFAGDRTLLTTLSPGGARGRERATVGFELGEAATVELAVLDRNAPGEQSLPAEQQVAGTAAGAVDSTVYHLQAGPQELAWEPPSGLAPGTYTLTVTATDATGRKAIVGRRGPKHPKLPQGPVVRVLGLDGSFTERSYAPGDQATLVLAADADEVTVQVFQSGPEPVPTYANNVLNGVPVTGVTPVDWRANLDNPAPIAVPIDPAWASGVYYARIESGGRYGYAPFVVRPSAPATRVAVVIPTTTWQAYNFYDADGDGLGDSWYVWWQNRTVAPNRPYLRRGIPYRYRSYDLSFLHWLSQTGKQVDFYADDDLETFAAGDDLKGAYDLVVFPGHTEYVTTHVYDVVQRYRDLGGSLMFLSANNFFRRVDRTDRGFTLVDLWRDLGRPEAALLGVQYAGSDRGTHQAPFVVTADGASSFVFADTGLGEGATFGLYGIEVDATTAATPPGAVVLAQIPNALGKAGLTAQMTYYETSAGAKVFSAGALNFGGQIGLWPQTMQLLDNVWARLAPESA